MIIYNLYWFMLERRTEALSYVHDYISRGQSTHHARDHCSGTLENTHILFLLFSITLPLYWDIKTMEVQNTERLFSVMGMEDGVMKDCGIAEIFKGYQWKEMGRWADEQKKLHGTTGWAGKTPSFHPSIRPLDCWYFKFHHCMSVSIDD